MAKIRTGFVSNSSSASYVVKFNIDIINFIELIYSEYDFTYFSIENLIERYEEKIGKYKELMRKEKEKPRKYYTLYTEEYLKELESKLNFLKSIGTLQDYESIEGKFFSNKFKIIPWILKNVYSVELTEEFNSVVLKDWTSMHNSYSDVSNILKDIIMYFDFEKPEINKIFKIEKDG